MTKSEAIDVEKIAIVAARQHNAIIDAFNKVNRELLAEGQSVAAVNAASYVAFKAIFERAKVLEKLFSPETMPNINLIVQAFADELEEKAGEALKPVASA